MGNRALICSKENNKDSLAVYVHWNGGRDSVEAFLKYAKMKGVRGIDSDNAYCVARLAQIIGNFFGGTTSVGIYKRGDLDDWEGAWLDNGVYLIDNDFNIVGRDLFNGVEQREHKLADMLSDIDQAQPEKERFGEMLNATPVDASELKVGDEIWFRVDFAETYEKRKIVGIGENKVVNGTNVKGMPYTDKYMKDNPSDNINNYISGEVRRA